MIFKECYGNERLGGDLFDEESIADVKGMGVGS
jgi:hypothetical protein